MSDYAELRELLRLAGNAPVFEPGIAPSTCDEAADAIEALIAERDALRHDIERHLAICSELATENHALRAALDRIIGMCCGDDVPARCTCGRPTGLPAVVQCAKRALSAEKGE
jgi:2-keto-4-pentenoate hydratase/2-oxohepta-3-ene-1,7-dioic acid hydratase in catechol pathway